MNKQPARQETHLQIRKKNANQAQNPPVGKDVCESGQRPHVNECRCGGMGRAAGKTTRHVSTRNIIASVCLLMPALSAMSTIEVSARDFTKPNAK